MSSSDLSPSARRDALRLRLEHIHRRSQDCSPKSTPACVLSRSDWLSCGRWERDHGRAGDSGCVARVVLEDGYCVVDDPGKRGARRWRTSALSDLSSSRSRCSLASLCPRRFLARRCL